MARFFSGSGAGLPTNYTVIYNGSDGTGLYSLGRATSTDAGATWTRYGSNPVVPYGGGTAWNSSQTHAPCVIWDGTQWVLYADGKGTNYQIGRWTSTDLIHFTPDAGNPIMGPGTAGQFDDGGVIGPQVTYNAALTPHWKMWYVGSKSGGTTTIGYADSTDGITWTKRGKVIDVGSAGSFDDDGVGLGCAILNGSTWYVYLAGQSSTWSPHYRSGYATVASGSEGTSAAYTVHGVISALAGNITSMTDGFTYQSNNITCVIARGATYIGYGTAFGPTSGPAREVSYRSTSTDLVTWTTPAGPLLPLSGGTFDTVSAENPSVVQA